MTFKQHLAASPILFVLTPYIGIENAAIAVWASFLIDIDHLHILFKEKAFSLKKIKLINERIHYPLIQNAPNRAYVDILYLFHTIEFNLILWIFSLYFPALLYVSIGFIYHMVFDALHHYLHKLPLGWLFLTNWVRYELRRDKPILANISD